MNEAMAATPELNLFISPFEIIRVAQEDVKLAELIFRQGQKKMLLWQQQMQQQNQQATIQGQIQSAQAAEQAKGQNLAMELQMKGAQSEQEGKVQKEIIVLQMVSKLAEIMATPVAVGKEQKLNEGSITPEIKQLMELSIKNIAIPLAMDNHAVASAAMNPPQEEQMEGQQQNNIQQ